MTLPQLQIPNCVSPLHTSAPLGEHVVSFATLVPGVGAGALERRAGAVGPVGTMKVEFAAWILEIVGEERAKVILTIV